jgi:hypothetical protein
LLSYYQSRRNDKKNAQHGTHADSSAVPNPYPPGKFRTSLPQTICRENEFARNQSRSSMGKVLAYTQLLVGD